MCQMKKITSKKEFQAEQGAKPAKKSHLNDLRIKKIMDLKIPYSEKLLEIRFKCYASFYVYLVLKNQIRYMDWIDNDGRYKLGLPVEVNVNQIRKEYGICKNTIKKALRELINVGLIEDVDWVEPKHVSCRVVLVKNDALIKKVAGKVVYTNPLTFNFYPK